MGQNRGGGGIVQGRGQVDFGPYYPQNEGGADMVAAVNSLPGRGTNAHPAAQAQVAHSSIHHHGGEAQSPQQGKQSHAAATGGLGGCGKGIGRKGGQGRCRRLHGGQSRHHLPGGGGSLGHHAHPAFQGEGEHQPQSHQAPQHTGIFPGHPLQQGPQGQQNQNHPPGGEAQPGHLPKRSGAHWVFSFPYASSIRRMSVTSCSDSIFPAAKAAMKAGREPSKVSSTNRWLCRA